MFVCILMCIYVCMCVCIKETVERRTWPLEDPGAQSQRQNTNREIHSRHTSLAPISLPPSTSLSLHSSPDLSLPFSSFRYHFYSWFICSADTNPPQSILTLVNIPPVNTALSYPCDSSPLLVSMSLPLLTSFPFFTLYLNAYYFTQDSGVILALSSQFRTHMSFIEPLIHDTE